MTNHIIIYTTKSGLALHTYHLYKYVNQYQGVVHSCNLELLTKNY